MLDRRLFDANLTVWGIVNEPAANPSVGTQYIVASDPAGAFAEATENSIARYDGSEWKFYAPKVGSLEVLNADTGEILQFNGTAWSSVANTRGSVAPVNNIVATGTTLPATAAEGDLFLKTDDAKLYTATAENTWNTGVTVASGHRYASKTDFKIYQSDGIGVKAMSLPVGEMFLNEADEYAYTYNGTEFVKVGVPDEVIIEAHVLTAAEATAKSFNLSNSVKAGTENNVMLSACGLAMTADVDFAISDSTVSWTGKGLDNIGLMAGDRFVVHYIKG